MLHLVLLFIVVRQRFKGLIQIAGGLPGPDHAKGQLRKDRLRLHGIRQRRAGSDPFQHGRADALHLLADALLLGKDGQGPGHADAGGHQSGKLAAKFRKRRCFDHAALSFPPLRRGLEIQPLRVERAVECFPVRSDGGTFHNSATGILCNIAIGALGLPVIRKHRSRSFPLPKSRIPGQYPIAPEKGNGGAKAQKRPEGKLHFAVMTPEQQKNRIAAPGQNAQERRKQRPLPPQ